MWKSLAQALAKYTGRFDHNIAPQDLSGDCSRVPLVGHHYFVFVHIHGIGGRVHLLWENPHHGIVFQQIGELLVLEQIVDADDMNVTAIT